MNKEQFEKWLQQIIGSNLENLAGLAPTLGHSEKYAFAERVTNNLTKMIIEKTKVNNDLYCCGNCVYTNDCCPNNDGQSFRAYNCCKHWKSDNLTEVERGLNYDIRRET
jgi:hypothetical protein